MRRHVILLGTLALLAGCGGEIGGLGDPFHRPGTFTLDAENAENLRAMIANPSDLQEGRGATTSSGYDSANAVARLRADNVKVLPDSSLASVGGAAGSGGQGSSGGGGGAAQ
jgi:hypothetical protein